MANLHIKAPVNLRSNSVQHPLPKHQSPSASRMNSGVANAAL